MPDCAVRPCIVAPTSTPITTPVSAPLIPFLLSPRIVSCPSQQDIRLSATIKFIIAAFTMQQIIA